MGAGAPITHKQVATVTGRPVRPLPVVTAAKVLRRVLRLSSEATTCSTHCRRRSVWQDGLLDTATSTTSSGSDRLLEVDICQEDHDDCDVEVAATMRQSDRAYLLSRRCYRFDLRPMLLSGSSALFCETIIQPS